MEIVKRKGGIKYREKIYVNGKEYKSPYFDKKTEVKKWKATMVANKHDSNFDFRKLGTTSSSNISTTECIKDELNFGAYADKWLEQVKTNKGHRTYECYFSVTNKHLKPFYKDLHLNEIKSDHGFDLIKRLKNSNHNNKGVNIILAIFKRILKDAFEKELIEKNGLSRVTELKEPPNVETYWTKNEISQFLRASLRDVNYELYVVALNSGLRRGELAGLCWDRIDFERNQIEVSRTRDRHGLHETTKTGIRRYVPMNKDVKRVLEVIRRKQYHPQFIFCEAYNEPFNVHHLYRDFAEAQKKSGLVRKIRFHDIRHTFASQFMMNGGSLYDLQKILGHSKIEMTMRYAHLSGDHLASAVNIVSFSGTTEHNEHQTDNFRPDLGLNLLAK